jgi:hypothetical protein
LQSKALARWRWRGEKAARVTSSHGERLVVTVITRIALRKGRDLGSKVLAE